MPLDAVQPSENPRLRPTSPSVARRCHCRIFRGDRNRQAVGAESSDWGPGAFIACASARALQTYRTYGRRKHIYVHCKELAHVSREAGSPTIYLPAVCELEAQEAEPLVRSTACRRRRKPQLPNRPQQFLTCFCSAALPGSRGDPPTWGRPLLGKR